MSNTGDPLPDQVQLSLFAPADSDRVADQRTASLAPELLIGKLYATPAAIDYMQRHGVAPGALVGRHAFGDPGELDAEDIAANARARVSGDRVLSAFAYGPQKERIWVITEADRSATTILLPADY